MKIRKIYEGPKHTLRTIPLELITIRRRIFLAYAPTHFCWLLFASLYFTKLQQRAIEHVFCSGLSIVYALERWNDTTTLILSQEKSLHDYIFSY